jgi:hypothetical protein
MKTQIIYISLLAWLALPQTGLAVITMDTFTTGTNARAEVDCGTNEQAQTGSMIGGSRFLRLTIGPTPATCDLTNPYRQKAGMQVLATPGLIFDSEFRVDHRLDVLYGLVPPGVVRPLNLDMTEGGQPNRRIRMTFNALDQGENLAIVLFMGNGGIVQCNINLTPSDNPFSVDLPLANFGVNFGTADFTDVDLIDFVFQSGGAVRANDFALRSITVTSAVNPAIPVASCNG